MDNKFYLVLFLTLVVFIIYNNKNKDIKEHFCPDKLTVENRKLILWKEGKVMKYFNNYSDYLKYYHSPLYS